MLEQDKSREEPRGVQQVQCSDLFEKLFSGQNGLMVIRTDCQESLTAMANCLRQNKTCKVGQTAKARLASRPWVTVFAAVRTMATTMSKRDQNPDDVLAIVAPYFSLEWMQARRSEKEKKDGGRVIRTWIMNAPDEEVGTFFATLFVGSAYIEQLPAAAD